MPPKVPDKVVKAAVSTALSKKMRHKDILKVLAEEGYPISPITLSFWINRRKRTNDPKFDKLFEGIPPHRKPYRRRKTNENN